MVSLQDDQRLLPSRFYGLVNAGDWQSSALSIGFQIKSIFKPQRAKHELKREIFSTDLFVLSNAGMNLGFFNLKLRIPDPDLPNDSVWKAKLAVRSSTNP